MTEIVAIVLCIALAAIAVLLLIGLFIDTFQPFTPLLATVLAGTLALALWCVVLLTRGNNDAAAKMAKAGNKRADTVACPDYFTVTSTSNGSIECRGRGVTLDAGATTSQMVYDLANDAPALNLTTQVSRATYNEVCAAEARNPKPYAWTSLRAKCAALKP